jgi:hypothetical protein
MPLLIFHLVLGLEGDRPMLNLPLSTMEDWSAKLLDGSLLDKDKYVMVAASYLCTRFLFYFMLSLHDKILLMVKHQAIIHLESLAQSHHSSPPLLDLHLT